MGTAKKQSTSVEINNKKVYHDYFVDETLECGVVLKGNEVKSIRKGSVSLKEAYVKCDNGHLLLLNSHITKWETANDFDVNETRPRVLLAHKVEIAKLAKKVQEKGMTLMPLKMYFSNGKCKLLIGLCRGKHNYDKRETEKKKQIDRDMQRYVTR